MNQTAFLSTLGRLISLGERLQNSVLGGKVPCERLAAEVVLERLSRPIASGAIRAELVANAIAPDRPNLILTLPGRTDQTIGFVGAHFDVVPANRVAEGWLTDPFQLVVEADGTLRGRGVTDCLGHVALLAELLASLVESGTTPRRTIHVVMIANEEESSVPGIGLDYVAALGKLEPLANGPIFWLDSADFGPTLGTGGVATWELLAEGVPGHSGMPQNCVNALELVMAAALELSRWFVERYPPHPDEARWCYASSSSMKATVVECDNRKVTMIPARAVLKGDIRLTPFYDPAKVLSAIEGFVADINADIATQKGQWAKYRTKEGQHGTLRFVRPEHYNVGVACRLDSPGLTALNNAIKKVRGPEALRPSSMTGALPLVSELQQRGFDVQITGFGRQVAYHAPNEYGLLKDFDDGFAILRELVNVL